MMQVIRDLTETRYGQNATVDKLLDHAILVVVPTSNPDGRVMGTRGNGGGANNVPGVADTNRDYFSAVPARGADRLGHAAGVTWRRAPCTCTATSGPCWSTATRSPSTPGTDAVNYYTWNTKRVTQTKADFAAAGMGLQSPVLDWNASGNFPTTYTIATAPGGATESGTTATITTTASNSSQISVGYTVVISGVAEAGYNGTFVVTGKPSSTTFTYTAATSGLPASGGGTAVSPAGPSYAQTWDGWGPFYGQTYMEFLGVDSSTSEMDDSTADGGRLTAKTGQYLNFYSSANYWLDNRQAMMSDQLKMFLNGVANAPTDMNAFADSPYLTGLGFTDYANNWMVQYPTAYIIPFGAGQRSDAEANRLVQWLLHNGVQVQVAKKDFTWNGHDLPGGLLHRVDEPGATRHRLERARRRHRHREQDHHPLRVARRLEPRAPVGRRHGRGAARRHDLRAEDQAGHGAQHSRPAASRRRQGAGQLVRRDPEGRPRGSGDPRRPAQWHPRRHGRDVASRARRAARCRPASLVFAANATAAARARRRRQAVRHVSSAAWHQRPAADHAGRRGPEGRDAGQQRA